MASTDQGTTYDGFISYSHAADGLLAPRLQAALQRFAKPWWRRRAVRIFRDDSSLAANPHLWSSITEALDTSGWFILLLSPGAARSEWVGKEIGHWRANQPADRILPVVTDGEFVWSDGDVCGTSVPPALHSVFSEEPRWVDLRFAGDEETLDLNNPSFAAAIADIASSIRGVPKDELASEEVRQHRRTVRTAWAAGVALLALSVLAVAAGVLAIGQSNEARDNADLAKARELAASAIGVVDEDPRLATWLTLTAIDQTPAGEPQPVEVVNALWEAVAADPLLATVEHGFGGNTFVDLSPDGRFLAISSAEGATLELRDAETFEILWSYSERTEDGFARPVFSPDGSMIAIDVMGSEAEDSWRESGIDDLPNRVIVIETASGEVVEKLEFPECEEVWAPAWSPNGKLLAVSPGFPSGCLRAGVSDPVWIEVFDAASWESQAIVSLEGDDFTVRAIFLSDERLGAFRSHNPLAIYDTTTFQLVDVFDEVASPLVPDVSIAGGLIAAQSNQTLRGYLYDLTSGSQLDVLGELEAWPSIPFGVTFSGDGGMLAYATDGRVLVWDVTTGEQTHQLNGGAGANNAVFNNDGTRLYSAHRDGAVRVWNLSPGGSVFEQIASFPAGSHVNGNDFRLGIEIGMMVRFEFEPEFVTFIEFFSTETGDLVAPPLITDTTAVPLSNDLIVGMPIDSDRYLLYDPFTGRGEPVGPDCADLDCSVVLSATRHQFAIVHEDEGGLLKWNFFDADTGEPVGSETHDEASRLADSFDDLWVLTVGPSGNFAFIDRTTGDEILRFDLPSGRAELSNSGRIVALRPGRTIVLVETETWETTVLDLGFGNMRGLTFSPDDSLLAVADEDEVLIVDLAEQEIVQEIPIPLVSDIHWIDESTLLVGDRPGSLWGTISLDVNDLIDRARAAVADRPLTSQECTTYRIDPCPMAEGDG